MIGTREQALAVRLELLKAEKELTRRSDDVARMRQALLWVRVDKDYRFQTDHGPASLAELFDGRSQLMIYHFMFGPDYTAGCPSRRRLGRLRCQLQVFGSVTCVCSDEVVDVAGPGVVVVVGNGVVVVGGGVVVGEGCDVEQGDDVVDEEAVVVCGGAGVVDDLGPFDDCPESADAAGAPLTGGGAGFTAGAFGVGRIGGAATVVPRIGVDSGVTRAA